MCQDAYCRQLLPDTYNSWQLYIIFFKHQSIFSLSIHREPVSKPRSASNQVL